MANLLARRPKEEPTLEVLYSVSLNRLDVFQSIKGANEKRGVLTLHIILGVMDIQEVSAYQMSIIPCKMIPPSKVEA